MLVLVHRIEIEGRNPKGRPKLTWRQVVRQDLERLGVEEEDVLDRDYWRFRLDCLKLSANLGQSRPSCSCRRDAL